MEEVPHDVCVHIISKLKYQEYYRLKFLYQWEQTQSSYLSFFKDCELHIFIDIKTHTVFCIYFLHRYTQL